MDTLENERKTRCFQPACSFISCRIELRVRLALAVRSGAIEREEELRARWILADVNAWRLFALEGKLVCCSKFVVDLVGVVSWEWKGQAFLKRKLMICYGLVLVSQSLE